MFSFGHCPNEGGGKDPARIKKTHYIYLFLTAEKDVQVARNGGGGGNSGNARKKTFFS